MAGADVGQPERHTKGKKRKKGRRLGIRIDLTPLVDVAFLLLTFFMYTTSMSRPQTMEINLPPNKEQTVEVAESNLLTLRVNEKGDVFWNFALDAPKRVEPGALVNFLREKYAGNSKLIVLLKVDRQAKYNTMVDIMDDLTNLAQLPRFSIGPMADQDKQLIANVK